MHTPKEQAMGDARVSHVYERVYMMLSNLEKYKKDLDSLVRKGESLLMAMQNECLPEQFAEALGDKAKECIKSSQNLIMIIKDGTQRPKL